MRLTLDWDDTNNRTLGKRLKALLQKFKTAEIRLSSGRKGYHIIVWEGSDTWKECIYLRRKFWDDKYRIIADNAQHKLGIPTQVLFTVKRKVKK